jgi:peptidoglycan/xylan/chitin deacetylase (PgdA/CDA1 family)
MFLVSTLLNHVAYPALAGAGYFRQWRRRAVHRGVSVLTYHGVLPRGYRSIDRNLDGNLVTAEVLRRQLTRLKRRYTVITPEQFLSALDRLADLPSDAVLLTCDDVLSNVTTDMLPVLQALDLKCLFFFTGAALDEAPRMLWHEELWLLLRAAKPGPVSLKGGIAALVQIPANAGARHEYWWHLLGDLSQHTLSRREEFLRDLATATGVSENWKSQYFSDPALCARFTLLPRTGLVDLLEAGMTLGTHTFSHPILSRCPDALARQEVAAADVMADTSVSSGIWAMAYPFGTAEAVSHRDVTLAQGIPAYRCAFLNNGGHVRGSSLLHALPRIHINSDLGLSAFEAHASGFHWNSRSRISGVS